MEITGWRQSVVAAVTGALPWLLVLLWLGVLFLQRGELHDEAEHSHVAWLMSQGKKPLEDFFQHHQPLLWNLLELYYRAGFAGAGVLLWGRVLVVLSGILSVVGLLAVGGAIRSGWAPGRWFGVAALVVLTMLFSELFVIRPETLATGFMLAALGLWVRTADESGARIMPLLAGVLAGAAVYSSPRFALFGGVFLLIGAQGAIRWLALIAGGVAFLLFYPPATGYSFAKILFNIQFSAHLQTIGDKDFGYPLLTWVLVLLGMAGSLLLGLGAVAPGERARGVLLVMYLVAVFELCARSAGHFLYPQAFSPFIVATSAAAAWNGARIRSDAHGGVLLGAAAVALLLVTLVPIWRAVGVPPLDIFAQVRDRNRLAAALPSGESVLVTGRSQPITAPDASWYANPLYDAPDRLCRAVASYKSSFIALPPCDYWRVILEKKPYLVETYIRAIVPDAQVPAVKHYVERHYRELPAELQSPYYMWKVLMIRIDDPAGGDRPLAGDSAP